MTAYLHGVLKGCVRNIFAGLSFKSKRKHLKSSFCSRENQISEFQIFRYHYVIKCLSIKQDMHSTEYLGSKDSLLMKFDQFMSYSKRNNFIKKFYKNCSLKTSSRPFCVCKELSTTSIAK